MWLIISDYYLENTPESISEHLFFNNFLGGMPSDSLAAPCFTCSVVYYARIFRSIYFAYVPLKAAELGHSTQNYLPPPLSKVLFSLNFYSFNRST